MKIWEKIVGAIGIMIIVWLVLSWVDVLAHNDPFNGDYSYSPVNLFVLIGEMMK